MKALKFDKILFLWIVAFVINIISFLFIQYKIGTSGPRNLKYNVLVGVEFAGSGKDLYLLPATVLALSILNLGLYKKSKKTGYLYAGILPLATIALQAALLVAVLFLSSVN
jgi:hypothetical protein